MTVAELIEHLNKVDDKSMPVIVRDDRNWDSALLNRTFVCTVSDDEDMGVLCDMNPGTSYMAFYAGS